MPPTPTSILRLELQAAQSNTGSWYINLNRLIDRMEDAAVGFLDVSTTGGDIDLTAVDYDADQGRMAYVRIANGQTLASGVRIRTTTPRLYFVHNAAANDVYAVGFGGDNSHLAIIPQGYGQLIRVHDDLTIDAVSPLITGDGLVQESVFGEVASKLPVATENLSVAVEAQLSTPPVSPSTGQRWIVAPTGMGAWSGKDNWIAIWTGLFWLFTNPRVGMVAFDKNAHTVLTYDDNSSGVISSDFPTPGWRAAVAAPMFPTGGVTFMLFVQPAPPAGWTQRTTVPRIVRATSGSTGGTGGGSVDFTTVFGLTAVNGRAHTQANMPTGNTSFTNNSSHFLTNLTGTTGLVFDPNGSPGG